MIWIIQIELKNKMLLISVTLIYMKRAVLKKKKHNINGVILTVRISVYHICFRQWLFSSVKFVSSLYNYVGRTFLLYTYTSFTVNISTIHHINNNNIYLFFILIYIMLIIIFLPIALTRMSALFHSLTERFMYTASNVKHWSPVDVDG